MYLYRLFQSSPGSRGEGVFTELAHVAEALDWEPHPVHRALVLPRLRLGPEHPGAVRKPAPELSRRVIPANVSLQTLLTVNLENVRNYNQLAE